MSAPALAVLYRLVRLDDAYLHSFDSYGVPVWVPKYEARRYYTQQQARGAARRARMYYGPASDVAVVRVVHRS